MEVVGFALTLAWALAAAVAARDPDQAAQWPVAAGALAGAVALTAARLASQPGAHQHRLAQAVATVAGPLVIASSVHFVLAAPNGRLAGQARRAAAGLAYLAAAGIGLTLALAGDQFPMTAAVLIWAAAVACALPAARLRYLKLGGRDRERMQWLAVGAVLAADAALVCAVLHVLVGWPAPVAAVCAGVTVAVPAGLAAGSSSRLAPLAGRLLVHILSIAGFSLVVAAIYLVIVLGLGKRPGGPGGPRGAGAVHARRGGGGGGLPAGPGPADGLRHPVRLRGPGSARRGAAHLRQPDDPGRGHGRAAAPAGRVAAQDDGPDQRRGVHRERGRAGTRGVGAGRGRPVDHDRRPGAPGGHPGRGVRQCLGLDLAARRCSTGGTGSSCGSRRSATRASCSGCSWWSGPGDADSFTEEDDRVLTELARQAGLAFYNVRLDAALQTTLDELRRQADELRESRARIVASGDAERRRVERDLHDGAQQHLVALAVNLRLARDIIADDPEAGAEMLDQMVDDVQATIQELRELAHGIYPPLLADAGLGEALRAAASRAALPVTVTADGIGRYSQGVETAVYFCCLEALQNAGKHAPGATAEVRLWEESGGLLFSVSDNGPGFDATRARSGHGFINMSDRLGAIGGTVRWESRPGHGATISGSVPIL